MNEKEVDHNKIKEAFKVLLSWVPEGVPLKRISTINYPVKFFGKAFQEGDDKQPFFSEAYLYNLLGKEDARTLLALMRRLCKAFEYDMEQM
jgi:hypothetical protein